MSTQPNSTEVANASSKKSILLGVCFVIIAMVLLALSGFIFFGEKEEWRYIGAHLLPRSACQARAGSGS